MNKIVMKESECVYRVKGTALYGDYKFELNYVLVSENKVSGLKNYN